MYVRTIHDVDQAYMNEVKTKMIELGAPTIHVYQYDEGNYLALEGTHRLAAAAALGLTPNFIEMQWEQEIGQHLAEQLPDYEPWYTVSDIFDEIFASSSFAGQGYQFNG